MFGLNGVKRALAKALDAQVRLWAGAAFMALALVAIEYEEVIAPSMSRIGGAWSGVAADFKTRLASFTL